ncbi:DUF3971 domain-containing protein [Candidatus Parabeggiatoa sp. HSG14]|uniref:YhdP family phospholipid transporter n=1 Tax=Candidatus Parabeggiatoa sp. HSG14 TaxID=3055593 RepID=UPI0032E3CB91
MFPKLSEYRAEIEQWMDGFVGQPIIIGSITTSWANWQPTIVLRKMQILEAETQQNVIEIAYAEIALDIWASISNTKIITNRFTVSGHQLTLARNSDGSIRIVGLPGHASTGGNKTGLFWWLLQQPSVSLHVTTLTWLEPEQEPLAFSNLRFTIEQQDSGPRMTGRVNLPQQAIQKIQAETLSFESWVFLNNSPLPTVKGQFTLSSFVPLFQQKKKPQSLKGDFYASQEVDGAWQIAIKQRIGNSLQQQWLPNEIQVRILSKDKDIASFKKRELTRTFEKNAAILQKTFPNTESKTESGTTKKQESIIDKSQNQEGLEVSGHIDVLPLDKLLDKLPDWIIDTITPELRETIMAVQGTLHNVRWVYTSNNWQVQSHFTDLIIPAKGQLPCINGLSGYLEISPNKGVLHFEPNTVTLNMPKLYSHPLSLSQLKGSISWRRTQNQWIFTTQNLQAIDKEMKVQVIGNVDIPLIGGVPNSNLTVTLHDVQLSQLQQYIPDQHLPDLTQQLADTRLKGLLNTVIFIQGQGKQTHFKLKGDFKNAKFHWIKFKTQNNKKVEMEVDTQGLSGQFDIGSGNCLLRLEKANVTFNIPHLYSHSLSLTRLNGSIHWQHTPQKWQVSIKQLQAFDKKMKLQFDGRIDVPQQGIPYSDLKVMLRHGQLSQIQHYLPDKKLKKAVDWFKQAQLTGDLSEAHALIRGRVNTLFDNYNKQSRFQLKGYVHNAHINYAPGWPGINDIKAELVIQKRALTITAQQGRIFNSKIQQMVVTIPDLMAKEKVIKLKGNLKGQAADGLRFVRQSPLHKHINLSMLEMNGHIGLQLKLAIPLSNKPGTVQGQIAFKNTTLYDKLFDLTLREVNGKLNFSKEKVSAKNLQGNYFGSPITFSVSVLRNQHPKRVRVQLAGVADQQFLSEQLAKFNPRLAHLPLPNYIRGKTHWRAHLDFPIEQEANNATNITFDADLVGMNIKLPAPFGKIAQEKRLLSVSVQLPGKGKISQERNQMRTRFSTKRLKPQKGVRRVSQALKGILVQVRYGSALGGVFHFDKTGLERGTLVLGTSLAQLPKQAILNIEGHIPSLSITAWLNQLKELNKELTGINKKSSGNNYQFSIPILTDVYFNQLELLGQTFTHVALQAKYAKQWWRAAITGHGIEGQITFNQSEHAPLLDLGFRELTLTLPQGETLKTTESQTSIEVLPDPHYLPPVSFYCKALQIGDIHLGNVDLRTQPNQEGLEIAIEAQTKGFDLKAKGQWRYVLQRHQTLLQATLNSEKVEQLLRQLGYQNPPIVGGHNQAVLNAYWQGAPYSLKLSKVVGTLSLVIIEGQIIDVEPGAVGRVFGLFDVSALPQRLILDFNDVFYEGFGFDAIAGTFFIKDGYARTDHLILQASSARIEISGETNFVEKFYNQTVTVFPHVSNPLPLAGALAGGIGGGMVALVAQQLLKGELEQVIKYQYRMTGPWKKPQIIPLSR